MKIKKSAYWSLAFIFIFFLSQDYLYHEWKGERGFLGFPIWIFWFGFIHILFIGLFYWFAKKYWKS